MTGIAPAQPGGTTPPSTPTTDGSAPAKTKGATPGGNLDPGVKDILQGRGTGASPGVPVKPLMESYDIKSLPSSEGDAAIQEIRDLIARGINTPAQAVALLAVVSAKLSDLSEAISATDTATKQKESKENTEKQLKNIQDAAEKAKEAQNMSWWQKLWGWVKAVVNVIVAAVVTVAAVATANPILMAMGAMMLVNSVLDLVDKGLKAAGKEGFTFRLDPAAWIGQGVAAIAGALGASDETKAWIQLGVTLAANIVIIAATLLVPGGQARAVESLGKFARFMRNVGQKLEQGMEKLQKASGLAEKAKKVENLGKWTSGVGGVVSGGAAVGEGVTTIEISKVQLDVAKSQAELDALKAMYDKLMTLIDQLTELMKNLQKSKTDIFSSAADSLNRSNQANKAIFKANPTVG